MKNTLTILCLLFIILFAACTQKEDQSEGQTENSRTQARPIQVTASA